MRTVQPKKDDARLARMRSVHKWSRTWKGFTVDPGTTGKIVGHHDAQPLYAVEWPGHSAVWVQEDHVDVLLPGDGADKAQLPAVQMNTTGSCA
jgi:hypothetical protein